MFNYYLTIGLTYLAIGFAVALLFHYVFRKPVLGRFWGALIIALVGSFLGGIIEFFFADIIEILTNLNNAVNIFPPTIAAFVLLAVFAKINERR